VKSTELEHRGALPGPSMLGWCVSPFCPWMADGIDRRLPSPPRTVTTPRS
jgi:hypothetical protein